MYIKPRVTKNLDTMMNYTSLDGKQLPDYLPDNVLTHDEECFGIYENNGDSYVLVTNIGLHIIGETKHTYASYSDIKKTQLPSKEKAEIDTIELEMFDHELIKVPILHGRDKFRDVFPFFGFLNRAIEIAQKAS